MEFSFSLLAPLLLVSNFFLPTPVIALHSNQAEGESVSLARSRTEIFHPPTGFCILRNRLMDPLTLGSCDNSDSWTYTPQKFLTIRGTYYCLKAVGPHHPAKLSIICTPSDSAWEILSSYDKTYFSTVLEDGIRVCLDIDGNDTVITNPCNGYQIEGDGEVSNDSQWFKLVQGPKTGVN